MHEKITAANLVETMKKKQADVSAQHAKRIAAQKSSAPTLYKVVIQKLVFGHKPTDAARARARRVVVVDAGAVASGPEFLMDVLRNAGALNDTTGEIVSVMPVENRVVVLSS